MTTAQRNLFGGTTEPKLKSKAQPKLQPQAAPAPQLPPNAELQRARNLASVRTERAKLKIGDIRLNDDPVFLGAIDPCECGAKRIGELVGIAIGGGQTWEWRCIECSANL